MEEQQRCSFRCCCCGPGRRESRLHRTGSFEELSESSSSDVEDEASTLLKPLNGNGFTLNYYVPYMAKHVRQELCSIHRPLGLDADEADIQVVREGADPMKPFSPP